MKRKDKGEKETDTITAIIDGVVLRTHVLSAFFGRLRREYRGH